jgi:hypothetical protein
VKDERRRKQDKPGRHWAVASFLTGSLSLSHQSSTGRGLACSAALDDEVGMIKLEV